MAGPGRLKPGEKGEITARMAAVSAKGSMVERIEVVSNDPKRPNITLTLRASVGEAPLPSLPAGIFR